MIGKLKKAKGPSSANISGNSERSSFQEELDREVAKRKAASEKERLDEAKKIAAEIQRRALVAAGGIQDGGSSSQEGTQANETPELLRNVWYFEQRVR